MGKLFGDFNNSKIASRKILSDAEGILDIDEPGNYTTSVSLKSNSKHTTNPTEGEPQTYGMSNKGGASGDKDVGYPGTGVGIAELNGSHSNDAKRKLAF